MNPAGRRGSMPAGVAPAGPGGPVAAPRPFPEAGPGAPASAPAVPSPCVSVCQVDTKTGLCLGCARTLDEIAAWSSLDDAAKREVWRRLPARRERLAREAPPR